MVGAGVGAGAGADGGAGTSAGVVVEVGAGAGARAGAGATGAEGAGGGGMVEGSLLARGVLFASERRAFLNEGRGREGGSADAADEDDDPDTVLPVGITDAALSDPADGSG